MTTYTAPDPKLLAQMADEVAQLTRPYTIPIRQKGRRTRTRWTAITHPPLLDQLNNAATPTIRSPQWDQTRHTGNQMIPINLAATDTIATIIDGITHWRWRIIPTHHPQHHWTAETLRALIGAAPNLAPSIAAELAADIHSWWRAAAILSGWNPDELRNT